jgi:hypothetical protein
MKDKTKDKSHFVANRPMEKAIVQNTLGRPKVTLLLDVYSRGVLTYYLSLEQPSYEKLKEIIRQYK